MHDIGVCGEDFVLEAEGVLAAKDKKARSAEHRHPCDSEAPSLSGKLAWIHSESNRSLLFM